MNVELNERENAFLVGVLKEHLGTLHQQVHHATISRFVETLKEEEKLVEGLIAKLEATGQAE